jgi:hypothetical protein
VQVAYSRGTTGTAARASTPLGPAAITVVVSTGCLGRVAEWQTRWLQVPVSFGTWGFKSPFAHQIFEVLLAGKDPVLRRHLLLDVLLVRRERGEGVPIGSGYALERPHHPLPGGRRVRLVDCLSSGEAFSPR